MKRLLLRISQTNACIIAFVKRIFFVINLWGTASWYKGIDKPTLWQRVYKWRISPKTAWTLANGIWLDGYSK